MKGLKNMNWSQREREMRQNRDSIITFADALKRVRNKMGWSHRVLAHAVGRDIDDVKDWEAGNSFPKGRDIARLKGVMEGIRPYMHLIPREKPTLPEVNEGGVLQPLPQTEETVLYQYELPEEVPIDFSSFGAALKGLRIREGFEPQDVAQLCGATEADITCLEESTAMRTPTNRYSTCSMI